LNSFLAFQNYLQYFVEACINTFICSITIESVFCFLHLASPLPYLPDCLSNHWYMCPLFWPMNGPYPSRIFLLYSFVLLLLFLIFVLPYRLIFVLLTVAPTFVIRERIIPVLTQFALLIHFIYYWNYGLIILCLVFKIMPLLFMLQSTYIS